MKERATELLLIVAFLFGVTIGMVASHFVHKWTIRFLGESLKDDVKDMSRSMHRNFEAVHNRLIIACAILKMNLKNKSHV